ncbi:MMPL family transporter [Tissierella carlieri]|uniref:efflux RND transporter permease subunit n=1 Tax=Tissierella carlieri TaxID=689904 RepID=UPI001C122E71|nr:MMPL family transporter [Tissierella carlieri]
MESFGNFIVSHKKAIIFTYILMIILSIITSQFVDINYDLSTYLPKEINSIKGKGLLEKEFGISGIGYILIKDKTFQDLDKIAKDLKSIQGIENIIWLGSAEDILKPEEFMDESIKKEFLNGNANLMQVQFSNSNDSRETVDAVEKIHLYIDDFGIIGGPASISHDLQKITSKEILYYSVIAFVIIFIVLFLSMESFIEPILFFIAIGVAIILNKGTNIIFPNVSFNTDSIASIIQLAVSMDYSIFLIHRYIEEKKYHENNDRAMVAAIGKTFTSVLSSSLTTVGGFLALIVMKYGIGKDIGLVLAKGVLFSLISVITLLPILVLLSDKWIEKYQHKIYLPRFAKSSHIIVKYHYVFLILAILIAIPSSLAQSQVKYYYANEKVIPKTFKSNVANTEIDKLFLNKNQLALMIPKGDKLKESELIRKLETVNGVVDIKGLYGMVDIEVPEEFLPLEVTENFQGENYSLININLNLPMEGASTKETLNNIKSILFNEYDEWYLTGESMIYADLEKITSQDFRNITIISTIVIGIIILLAFKSLIIPIILVSVIQLGIWINLAIPYMQGISLNFISFIIIGAIQLGATVDYAILYTARYLENIEQLDKKEAAIKTIKDTGRPILTSALILFTGTLSVYLITSMKNTAELTLLIGRGAIISFILVLVVLPSLLIIFNSLIKKTTSRLSREINN